MLIFWLFIFIASIALLVKSADWLIDKTEKIAIVLGVSPFIIAVTIVGVGTSLPELSSSFFATIKGLTDVAPANAIGSNIANILLIVGVSAVLGKKLVVTKSLIDLDLPLLAIGTVLFLGISWDQKINLIESILMLLTYAIYLLYTIIYKEKEDSIEINEIGNFEVLPLRIKTTSEAKKEVKKIEIKDIIILILGLAGLFIGANFLIKSLIKLSEILKISTGVITITAVALGTSLPELFVSAKAALQKKPEIALGNIFGSNIFNALVVVGFCGIFKNLILDPQTFLIGLPTMVITTLLFTISGISRRIHLWEGLFYLVLYIFFIGKLFNLF